MQSLTTVDFSRYVAIGDSITAGYMDGALYHYGQTHHYAYFLAQQFKKQAGSEFHQALISPDSVGLGFWGTSCIIKKSVNTDINEPVEIEYISNPGDLSIISSNLYQVDKPFQNLGIPATKLTTLLYPSYGNPENGQGNYNPFYTRIASNPKNSSVLQDALIQQPTFFSLFAGNNDALAYALSGCTENSLTPVHGDVGIGFEASARAIIDSLVQIKAKGVIANLPNLNATSYFKTIPYNGLVLTISEAENLNKLYVKNQLFFNEGKSAFVINDDSKNGSSVRLIQKGEYILLDVLLDPNKKEYLMGLKPIPKKYILMHSEITLIQDHIDAYNLILKNLAKEYQLAFVDTDKLLRLRSADRVYDPKTQNCFYKKNGVFSLDGLHPNTYGHALLANECILQINNNYQLTLPTMDADFYKNNEPPVLINK